MEDNEHMLYTIDNIYYPSFISIRHLHFCRVCMWFVCRYILVYLDIRLQIQSDSHSQCQYLSTCCLLKPVTDGTSSRMEFDSNNCVVGLMVLHKIMRMEESKVLRQCLS